MDLIFVMFVEISGLAYITMLMIKMEFLFWVKELKIISMIAIVTA